jgi:hypothetical protein
MPNYINLIGEYYPSMEAYCAGDPTVYAEVIQLGSPVISQAELDGLTESSPVEPIEVPETPNDADILQFASADNIFHAKSPAAAGISETSHTHTVDDLSNTLISSVGLGEVLVYQGSPAKWQNNTLAEASISAVGHNHTASDITDFNTSVDARVHYKQLIYGTIAKLSGTTSIPDDNTTPTVSEGTQIWTGDITPSSTASLIKVNFSVTLDSNVGGGMGGGTMDIVISVFRDSTCIGTMSNTLSDDYQQQMAINLVDAPSTVAQVTYSARVGRLGIAGTWYLNRLDNERFNNTMQQQAFTLEEVHN